MERIVEAASERGCFLEINARPDRLDLDDVHSGLAKEIGVKPPVSTDAHSPADLGFMDCGVDQARRGWPEPGDAIITRPARRASAAAPAQPTRRGELHARARPRGTGA